eukprot:362854-Chlamydomonas_euryale.AAC.4
MVSDAAGTETSRAERASSCNKQGPMSKLLSGLHKQGPATCLSMSLFHGLTRMAHSLPFVKAHQDKWGLLGRHKSAMVRRAGVWGGVLAAALLLRGNIRVHCQEELDSYPGVGEFFAAGLLSQPLPPFGGARPGR